MKTLFRLSLIGLAVLLVVGATVAALQTSAVQNLLPARGEGNRPAFNQAFNNDFDEGQRPPAFDDNGEGFGRRGREGSGWEGLGAIIKNLTIFGLMLVAAIGLSTLVTRWQAKNTARQPIPEESQA